MALRPTPGPSSRCLQCSAYSTYNPRNARPRPLTGPRGPRVCARQWKQELLREAGWQTCPTWCALLKGAPAPSRRRGARKLAARMAGARNANPQHALPRAYAAAGHATQFPGTLAIPGDAPADGEAGRIEAPLATTSAPTQQHLRVAPWLPWHSRSLRRPRTSVPEHWTPRQAGHDRGVSLGAGRPGSGGVGQVVSQQWLANTTTPHVGAQDRRRLDLVVYGALRSRRAQCCDATLVSWPQSPAHAARVKDRGRPSQALGRSKGTPPGRRKKVR